MKDYYCFKFLRHKKTSVVQVKRSIYQKPNYENVAYYMSIEHFDEKNNLLWECNEIIRLPYGIKRVSEKLRQRARQLIQVKNNELRMENQ